MPFISSVRGSYGAQGRFGKTGSPLSLSTGGTITTAGGYRIHTFSLAASGTNFVPSASGTVEYLIIGGGGSGGNSFANNTGTAGGGGAGGYRAGSTSVSSQNYAISVGNGAQTNARHQDQ